MRFQRICILVVFGVAAGAATFGVWRWSFQKALEQTETRGIASLSLASDRLVGLLERYRILPVALASDDVFILALTKGGTLAAVQSRLQSLADMTGAQNIALADKDGNIVASSSRLESAEPIASKITNRPDFRRAMNGALGIYHAQESQTLPRGFMFSSAIRDSQGTPIGALVINADLETLEFHWRGDPEIIFFTDKNNVIFIANRDNLILRVLGDTSPELLAGLFEARYKSRNLQPMKDPAETSIFGRRIWNIDGDPDIPNPALLVEQPLPVIAMTAHILLDIAPVAAQARLRAMLSVAVFLLIGLVFWILQLRRAALSNQLEIRKDANAKLEERVQKRTMQLTAANQSLRRAQDDLVQAGKLAALGEMSAGISHELNQPLAAIQSFSENASVFAERGQIEKIKDNLERIAGLTSRMARIITNLRAFSRKEGEKATDVLLAKVVDDALEIAATKIKSEKVSIVWRRPRQDHWVKGGPVRLQQVVMNLISNAIDAMHGMGHKTISISIEANPTTTRLIVRDNGPGLEAPGKIFDPFYTTKSLGHPNGMGLGLSISYGIVQSFGGRISGQNHPDGGAEFTVSLDSTKNTENTK